jgi:hypothetical protein
MAPVTFSEAARRLGHKSRSTLYRLRDEKRIEPYLVKDQDGKVLLELAPSGRPTLEAFLAGILDPRRGPWSPVRHRREGRDRRWQAVAGVLTGALGAIRGPVLSARDVELLAERMGPALGEVFPDGAPGGVAPEWIGRSHWPGLAADVNRSLRELEGWRLPPLAPWELAEISSAISDAEEGTEYDRDSLAYRAMWIADTEDHPHPDPWKCRWCGEPWHENHPEYRETPEEKAWGEALKLKHADLTDHGNTPGAPPSAEG